MNFAHPFILIENFKYNAEKAKLIFPINNSFDIGFMFVRLWPFIFKLYMCVCVFTY